MSVNVYEYVCLCVKVCVWYRKESKLTFSSEALMGDWKVKERRTSIFRLLSCFLGQPLQKWLPPASVKQAHHSASLCQAAPALGLW